MIHRTLAIVMLISSMAFAADPPATPLWPDLKVAASEPAGHVSDRGTPDHPNRFVSDIRVPSLTLYPAPAGDNAHVAVIVCPGGGYAGLAVDKEGHEMARWLNTLGVTAVLLQYRMPHPEETGTGTPLPLLDVQRAIRYVRSKASEWGVDPHKVGVLGFSAGGHLASTAATHFDDGARDAADPVERYSCRPDFVLLGYPVISMHPALAHRGSRDRLLGKDPSPGFEREYSNEEQVTPRTPPTFLFLAKDDKGVKPANSEAFYEACKKAGVPVEIHEYNHGGHGFGMGKGDSTQWTRDARAWLEKQGILPAAK